MRIRTCAIGLLLAAMPVRGQDMDPTDLEKRIDNAIKNGVAWLKNKQKSDGSFGDSSGETYVPGKTPYPNRPGNCALALLALLKSDVDPRDPVIQKGMKFLNDYLGNKGNQRTNYDRGVALMAVEAFYEGMVLAKMKKDGRKVTERAGDFKEPKYALSPPDMKFATELVKELIADQTKQGGWRYGTGFTTVGSDEDMSATQIALLGLKSAIRMRVPVTLQVFQRALMFILDSQEKNGPNVERPSDSTTKPGDRSTYVSNGKDCARGWAYELKSEKKDETTTTGSMTCSGVTGLLICKSVLGKTIPKQQNEKAEQSIYDGFAWLTTNWSVERNPNLGRSHYYYLYGIERVATLGCYERIGNHMWFKEGAQVLVRSQREDGSWMDQEVEPKDLYATCFALLFLRRGTVPIGDVMTGERRP